QPLHLQGPPLSVLYPCAFEFPQVMRVAEEVDAVELEVGFPVIVTETPVKVFQDAHGFDGITAACGVREEQGPLLVTTAMQTVERLVDMDAGFVGVQGQLLDQLATE